LRAALASERPKINWGGFGSSPKTVCDVRILASEALAQRPLLMLWTAPPPARECHESGRC